MVNVLVIGATGYIGQTITQSLIRSGDHRVYGLARTSEKARALEREEVIPIQANISEDSELPGAIEARQINVVVDLIGSRNDSQILLKLVKSIAEKRVLTSKVDGSHSPRLGYIYCSGSWVHGSSNIPINDLAPVGVPSAPTPPAELVAWRTKLEKDILASSNILDVMIVRPALVYGRANTIWTSLLQPIYSAAKSGASSVSIAAEADSRPGLVHVDDVGSGFCCAIEQLPLISGTGVYPVFDLSTSQESMRDILETAAREFGFKGEVKLVGTGDDLFAKAMSTSFNSCSGRAKSLLGWKPTRFGFVKDMDVVMRAWMASAEPL